MTDSYPNIFAKHFGIPLLFLLVSLGSYAQEGRFDDKRKVEWLKGNIVKVNSIDPGDTAYGDLSSLRKAIGDSRVVLLGEQSHGDGSTFEAKARLVRFLHQEMGFEVLAFESDFYGCLKAWENIRSGKEPLAEIRKSVYYIWSESRQAAPVFEYIKEKAVTARPLILSGFDCQQIQETSRLSLVSDLDSVFSLVDAKLIKDQDYIRFKGILKGLIDLNYLDRTDSAGQAFFFGELERLRNLIPSSQQGGGREVNDRMDFGRQLLASLKAHAANAWSVKVSSGGFELLNKYGNEFGNVRDRQMADNALWLIKNRYKGKKIILWGATFHFAHDLGAITGMKAGLDYSNTVTMGQILKEELGDGMYTIGFSSYSGEAAIVGQKVHEIPPATKGGIDQLLYATGAEYCFFNLRNMNKDAQWLREENYMRPLGHAEMKARWPDMMDGVFFINRMHPSTY